MVDPPSRKVELAIERLETVQIEEQHLREGLTSKIEKTRCCSGSGVTVFSKTEFTKSTG